MQVPLESIHCYVKVPEAGEKIFKGHCCLENIGQGPFSYVPKKVQKLF
jgi:hypothetical protein